MDLTYTSFHSTQWMTDYCLVRWCIGMVCNLLARIKVYIKASILMYYCYMRVFRLFYVSFLERRVSSRDIKPWSFKWVNFYVCGWKISHLKSHLNFFCLVLYCVTQNYTTTTVMAVSVKLLNLVMNRLHCFGATST